MRPRRHCRKLNGNEILTALGSVWLALLGAACAGPDALSDPLSADPQFPEVSILRDLPYAVRDGETLRADVYRARPGRLPAVVVIHPGGWFSGDKRHVGHTARRLARAGYVAIAPRYRLAPEHRYPAQIHDLKEVVRWMRVESSRFGLDPDRIAAFGYSSGGHLAALLATSDPEDGLEGPTAFPDTSSRIQVLVAGASPSDLHAMPPNPAVSRLLGGSASDHPKLATEASPVSFVSPDDPPAFLYHGRLDPFVGVGQSRLLLRALEREGVPAKLELGLLGHFTTFLFRDRQVTLAVDFLDRWIGDERESRVAADVGADSPS